jgi:hypothetical protein
MSRFKKLISLAIFTLLLIGCAKGAVWQKTLDSSQTQNPTERIAVLKKTMGVEAPTKIVEAQYIEYQIGDNFLGPPDKRKKSSSFTRLSNYWGELMDLLL